jgi:hypothetical protein
MLLMTVDEQDPIYQLCEDAVNKYIETLDESYLIAFCEDKDDDDYKVMFKHKTAEPPMDELVDQMSKDAANLSSNPFIARKKVMDMDSDFASRAQGIGVHQPQKKMMASNVFWTHPNTVKGMKMIRMVPVATAVAAGLKNIYDYEHKPVGVIAKKIASLRKVLSKLKSKISGGGILPKQKNILQKVAIKVTEAIDKLLKFAQKTSSNFSREFAKK